MTTPFVSTTSPGEASASNLGVRGLDDLDLDASGLEAFALVGDVPQLVEDEADLAHALRDVAAEGDIVLCMGAGDITRWAANLEAGIKEARASK